VILDFRVQEGNGRALDVRHRKSVLLKHHRVIHGIPTIIDDLDVSTLGRKEPPLRTPSARLPTARCSMMNV
jgi:hypothetical protein